MIDFLMYNVFMTDIKDTGEIGYRFAYTGRLPSMLEAQRGYVPPSKSEHKYGEFAGRAIIGRDSPINGGVFVAANKEVIVVDDKEQPMLKLMYNILRKRLENNDRGQEGVLEAVFKITEKALPYTTEIDDSKIDLFVPVPLQKFVVKDAAECRHQALLAGYMLERLVMDGVIKGKVSIERNISDYVDAGHAWVRFTDEEKRVYIVDVAKHMWGLLPRISGEWSYKRPEDL